MKSLLAISSFLILLIASVSVAERFPKLDDTDWGWWRGPTHNGIAATSAKPPLTWDDNTNILWQTEILGRGHSSPTVVGDRVFLTTADEAKQTQYVLCFKRSTGDVLWSKEIYQGNFDHNNKKNSFASSSVSCDGQQIYTSFFRDKKILTVALTLQGELVWEHVYKGFASHQGFGSSPLLYKELVIMAADNKAEGGGLLTAVNRKNGEIIWETPRPKCPNYVSPTIYRLNGRDELLMAGCEIIASYNPDTGKPYWEHDGSTEEVVGNVATDGKYIFASGGYPKRETWCWLADGSGKLVWKNSVRTYVPSLLVLTNHLFTVTDDGIAYLWKKETGEEVWKQRLGGQFSASPILANGHIYASSETGTTWVLKPTDVEVDVISKNQLGTGHMSTPAFSGKQIFLRVIDETSGEHRERLVCVQQ
jgi:outer membrane protein assembly factor BamB